MTVGKKEKKKEELLEREKKIKKSSWNSKKIET